MILKMQIIAVCITIQNPGQQRVTNELLNNATSLPSRLFLITVESGRLICVELWNVVTYIATRCQLYPKKVSTLEPSRVQERAFVSCQAAIHSSHGWKDVCLALETGL